MEEIKDNNGIDGYLIEGKKDNNGIIMDNW